MNILIESELGLLTHEVDGQRKQINLYSKEAFEILSNIWLKVGWNEKYAYTFSWMGRQIIQNPEDIVRTQEIIYQVKPDVIIEIGIAHGGGLIFYASLCKSMGRGRVIGVDVEIRPHNRQAIENHELFPYITLIEGNSIDLSIIQLVKSMVNQNDKVMVFLDSNHTKSHVLAELEAYHSLVAPNSYIVATDGIMKDLFDVPRGNPEWKWNHPAAAAADFIQVHPEFIIEQPRWPFNESQLNQNVTHWPGAWIKKKQ